MCLHIKRFHYVITFLHSGSERLLRGSTGQIIEIGSPLYGILWLHISQELHHLNWNWLCEVDLVLKHREIQQGSRDLVGNNNSIKE